MKLRLPFLARAMSLLLLASSSACEGDESSSKFSGGGNPGGSFIAKMCSLLAPCCVEAGMKSNPSACAQVYGAYTAELQYDADAAEQCEEALRTASQDGKVCALSTLGSDSACSAVYKNTGGTRSLGQTCDKDTDCITQPLGSTECLSGYDLANNKVQTCSNVLEGSAGASPCIGYKSGSYTVYNVSGPPPAIGYLCDQDKGMTCDAETKTCTMLAAVGEACTWSFDCVSTAWCDSTTKLCQNRVGPGGACSDSGAQCDATTYCSDANVCTTLLENGQACNTSGQCKSDSCTNGACKAVASLELMFLCQQ